MASSRVSLDALLLLLSGSRFRLGGVRTVAKTEGDDRATLKDVLVVQSSPNNDSFNRTNSP